MRFAVIAIALALTCPVAGVCAPQAPTQPAPQVARPDPALQQAKADAETLRQVAIYYRDQAVSLNDQLAVALAKCGAPCRPPQQSQH